MRFPGLSHSRCFSLSSLYVLVFRGADLFSYTGRWERGRDTVVQRENEESEVLIKKEIGRERSKADSDRS